MRPASVFAVRPFRILGLTFVVLAATLSVPSLSWGATRSLSTSGTDSGTCLTSPCRSFSYAYRQAAPGDVVEVAAGTYGPQSIPRVAGRAAPAVEFRRQGGASVTLGGLDIAGGFVTVRDIWTGDVAIDAGDSGLTPVDNVSLINGGGQWMWIQTARNLLVKGGSYGGNQNGPTVQTGGTPASTNLTFDGVEFHDAVATNDTVHMECIWAGGVQGFTVRNSIFRNCAYFDIFFTTLNGPDPKDVLLENNVFEVTKQWNGQNAPYAINVANWLSKAENFTFRNNVFGGDVAIQPTSIVNMKLVGNIGAVASCKGGVSYSNNVFTNAKCSTTDKQVGMALTQFVNPAGHDWRPTFGAAAIDAGNPNDYPPTDRGGLLRNGPPDAGAHEYGGISPGGDAQAPSVPAGVSATGGVEQVALTWSAASDNVGVVRYNVHRSTVAGFTPSAGNRVAQPAGTSYTDSGLAASRYYYRVTAEDAAANVSAASAEVNALAAAESTPPSVSVTSPSAGATVSGTLNVAASASDNRGVSGVQLKLDGQNLGAEDTTAPYSVSWNTTTSTDGAHTVTAVARDAAGNSATSQVVSVTVDNVPAPDTQAPSAPTGVSATGGVQQVALSWSAASDNVGVVRYNVHRSTVSGFTPSAANRVAQPTGTSYTDSGLAAGTYFYKVTAEDAAVNVGPSSAQASAIASPPADTQAPTVPAGVSATGGLEQVALNWSAASDNVGVVRYNVHRSTVSGFTPSAGNRVAQPTGASYTDIGLAPGTYYYKVTAQDAAANVSPASAQVNALAAAEQTPPSVSMTSPAAGATLAGTATVAANASDNRGVASVQFRVDGQNLGAPDTSAPYSLPWNTTTSTEGAHTVTAVARDAAGNSATSQQLAVTVDNVPADTQAPSVPAGVSASDGVEQVVVSWSAASDNVGVWRYNLHRSTVAGFTPSTVNRVAQPAGTSYTDSGLPAGRYYYRVTAEDAASNVSAVSAEVNALAGAEQTPPSVSLTSPGAGATVTGTATVAASASDNRGVSGVQFKLDGQNLGAEDTSAPYSVPWNTTSAATGAHAVTAVARDAAGNKASAGEVSVTVIRTTTKSRGKKKNQETVTPLTDPVAPSLTLLDTPTVQDSGVIYLAVRASSAGRVVGTVKRVGSSRKARRIWRMTRAVKRGRNRVRFSTRGWKHARYRVTVRVFDGPRLVSKPVRLRVAVLDAGPVRVARLRF